MDTIRSAVTQRAREPLPAQLLGTDRGWGVVGGLASGASGVTIKDDLSQALPVRPLQLLVYLFICSVV